MKIIKVDNFDREDVNDVLIAENVHEFYGEHLVEFLNEKFSGEHSPNYYKLVADNYKLFVFKGY